jgi:hypothetical protein
MICVVCQSEENLQINQLFCCKKRKISTKIQFAAGTAASGGVWNLTVALIAEEEI